MKKKLNSRGFSLVELIIVIALMAALVGSAAFGISYVMGMKAKATSDKIYNQITEAKTYSLGFDDVKIRIFEDDGNFKTSVGKYEYTFSNVSGVETRTLTEMDVETDVVGEKGVSVKFMLAGDSTLYDVKDYSILFGFDRTSGAFTPATVTKVSDGSEDSSKYLDKIIVSQSTREVVIKCVRLTGKFFVE